MPDHRIDRDGDVNRRNAAPTKSPKRSRRNAAGQPSGTPGKTSGDADRGDGDSARDMRGAGERALADGKSGGEDEGGNDHWDSRFKVSTASNRSTAAILAFIFSSSSEASNARIRSANV